VDYQQGMFAISPASTSKILPCDILNPEGNETGSKFMLSAAEIRC
jgi:hypothetical protein